ncbi:hypothetical protein [Rufibacter soli]
MDSLTILLMPNFNQTRKSMGYGEDEDYDSDAVGFQQGYDMHMMEIEPGEQFSIGKKWQSATLQCDGRLIKVKTKNEWGDDEIEEDDDLISLAKGFYLFNEDGETIEKIEDKDFDEDDFDEDEEY